MKRFLAVIITCLLCSYLMISEANCFVKLPARDWQSDKNGVVLLNVDLIKSIEINDQRLELVQVGGGITYTQGKLKDHEWARKSDDILSTLKPCLTERKQK